ncbi:MAG: NAD(P)-dependent alcohol dehydrogenase [Pseudoflavonifractor sp.]|nr:NAD(P)-dependent alcohol dehydrogenase [Pseudoflavonifractor sp.]
MNRAAYMTGLNRLEMREVPMPIIDPGQVLVKLEYVGICGSDVHYYEHGRIGDFIVEGDFILGHECAGEVVEIGENVTTLQVGDKVALEPGQTCGECEYCKTGRYNLCEKVEFLATPPYDGCFENYIAYPENMAFKLPDNITTKEGALIEPLAVGLEAASVAKIGLGTSVVIIGSGCIGLTTLLAAKASGATDVTVIDMIDVRLKKAMELGATRVVNAATQDVINEVNKATDGKGADVVIETAGAVKTTQETVDLVKRGGTVLIVGMAPQDKFEFNFAKLMGKVAEIKTIFRYKNMYPKAINAVSTGLIDISKIVTHEFNFDDITHAFDVNIHEKSSVVKAIIKI